VAIGVILLIVLALTVAGYSIQSTASRRADRQRTYSSNDANMTDQLRFIRDNPAALPMHDRSFDKPR